MYTYPELPLKECVLSKLEEDRYWRGKRGVCSAKPHRAAKGGQWVLRPPLAY